MPQVNKQRIADDIEAFAAIGRTPDGGVTRLAYTEEEDEAHNLFTELAGDYVHGARCETTYSDQISYSYGMRNGLDTKRAPIGIVSHLDTVPNGGRLDGALGVIAGLEVVRVLREHDIRTRRGIKVVAFRAEESARFGHAFIGSLIASRKFDLSTLDRLHDGNGVSLRKAMREGMSDLANLEGQIIQSNQSSLRNLAAMLELHVEQGPVLEHEKIQVGIVSSIVKATRLKVTLRGRAAHSGTTPMDMRCDALAAAAQLILDVESIGQRIVDEGTRSIVATAGRISVEPNAMNVIPAKVEVWIDIRAQFTHRKSFAVDEINNALDRIVTRRGVTSSVEVIEDGDSVQMSPIVKNAITHAAYRLGLSKMLMPSGAGHDCMNFASQCPTGMIFVPSKDGVSHHYAEDTDIDDITPGVQLLLDTVLELDEALP